MKLSELLVGQRVVIQLLWGEKKIEFTSEVLGNDQTGAYVSAYLHGGSVLELDVNPSKGVICNIYADNTVTKQRVSWKGVSLSTVEGSADGRQYLITTNSFNYIANEDDRRSHGRLVIHKNAVVSEVNGGNSWDVIVHDISDIGISFYAPSTFVPQSYQFVAVFSDEIDNKEFNIRIECTITRTERRVGNTFVGCKILSANKDYLLYGFLMRLREKNKRTIIKTPESNENKETDDAVLETPQEITQEAADTQTNEATAAEAKETEAKEDKAD